MDVWPVGITLLWVFVDRPSWDPGLFSVSRAREQSVPRQGPSAFHRLRRCRPASPRCVRAGPRLPPSVCLGAACVSPASKIYLSFYHCAVRMFTCSRCTSLVICVPCKTPLPFRGSSGGALWGTMSFTSLMPTLYFLLWRVFSVFLKQSPNRHRVPRLRAARGADMGGGAGSVGRCMFDFFKKMPNSSSCFRFS